jgi:hypothetical protein
VKYEKNKIKTKLIRNKQQNRKIKSMWVRIRSQKHRSQRKHSKMNGNTT